MSIRFQCRQCSQLLSIAGRKAGTQIGCPKCGATQTVPSQQAANAATAMASSTEARKANGETSTDASYDDRPSPVGPQPAPVGPQPPPPPQPTSAAASPAHGPKLLPPLPVFGSPVPSGMILYRRRTIYVQGLLLLVFVAVPLPVTGAWTGALGAWVLGLRKRKAVLYIALGVLAAGVVVSAVVGLGVGALSFLIKRI